jgi:hypothetical protein
MIRSQAQPVWGIRGQMWLRWVIRRNPRTVCAKDTAALPRPTLPVGAATVPFPHTRDT